MALPLIRWALVCGEPWCSVDRDVGSSKGSLYGPRRRDMLGASHPIDALPIFEYGWLPGLGEAGRMGTSYVFNTCRVRSVPSMLHLCLTRVSPRRSDRPDRAQLQEHGGSTVIHFWAGVHVHVQVSAVYRRQRCGPLCCGLQGTVRTGVRHFVVFRLRRVRVVVGNTWCN